MTDELILKNSKNSGRPKSLWTQKDTAAELGISQQSVSVAIRVAKIVEAFPLLAKCKGVVILSAWKKIQNEEVEGYEPEELEVVKIIAGSEV